MASKSNATTSYEPVDPSQAPLSEVKDSHEEKGINTTIRYAWYGSGLLALFIGSFAFWIAGRYHPILLSLSASQTVLTHAKSMTFVWTLIGTILAFTTGTLFNQLLKISLQQKVAEQGLKIGLIEFWTRVYSRKWLHDHKNSRLFLSAFSVIFAIACGLLVSAYTGLVTPTYVYIQGGLSSSELDLSSDAFGNWYDQTGVNLLYSCAKVKMYGKGADAVSLALCPQVKDPLPYVSAGLASIEAKYAKYAPTTNVLGMSFNGTTKGVLPHGWNTIPYFNTFPAVNQPPVLNYNYSMVQQGVSTNVTCMVLGQKSNITWMGQSEAIEQMTNGNNVEQIYLQNMTFANKALGIDYQDNFLLSGTTFVATFPDTSTVNEFRLEFSSYGAYRSQWQMPNMTCLLAPYLTDVNVTYNNATGQFTGEVIGTNNGTLRMPSWGPLNEVNNWLFRVFTFLTGNQIINSIIALQNTPSYDRGVFSNVTIDWPTTMELFLQGQTEYHATRLRMIMEAEINSTGFQPSGFKPVTGQVASWRLGYNGETAPIATLFPLQGFIFICAVVVVTIGSMTGVKHVSKFDPTNTTHLIVASAQGASRGGLHALRGEDAIHADAKALNLKIEYNHLQGFQEVSNLSNSDYTELSEPSSWRRHSEAPRQPKQALFSRFSMSRNNTR